MDISNNDLAARFSEGDFAVIMSTDDAEKLGISNMACELLEKIDDQNYLVEISCSDFQKSRTIVSVASMNPVSMKSLAHKANTHLYWLEKHGESRD